MGWNIPAEQCALALEGAIDAGYKCLDFAAIYGNEAAIGPTLSKIFKSGKAKREDLYILSVDIAVMGYCTLGPGKPDMTLDVVKKASERLKVTPAQVLMKWSTQKGYLPITKSVTPDRIKSNKELAFELNEEEMKALDGCDGGLPMKVCDHASEMCLPIYD